MRRSILAIIVLSLSSLANAGLLDWVAGIENYELDITYSSSELMNQSSEIEGISKVFLGYSKMAVNHDDDFIPDAEIEVAYQVIVLEPVNSVECQLQFLNTISFADSTSVNLKHRPGRNGAKFSARTVFSGMGLALGPQTAFVPQGSIHCNHLSQGKITYSHLRNSLKAIGNLRKTD